MYISYIPLFSASPTYNAIIYYSVPILKRFHLIATHPPLNYVASLRLKDIIFISAGCDPFVGRQLYSLLAVAVRHGAGLNQENKFIYWNVVPKEIIKFCRSSCLRNTSPHCHSLITTAIPHHHLPSVLCNNLIVYCVPIFFNDSKFHRCVKHIIIKYNAPEKSPDLQKI
jgi:hypothetical protein